MENRGNTIALTTFFLLFSTGWAAEPQVADKDPRNMRNGLPIPSEGYCDQPYVVVLPDGRWLCVLTTGKGEEGQRGQHVVATLSPDQGRTWSKLVDIEPADGPEASWAVPLLTPAGRVYHSGKTFADRNPAWVSGGVLKDGRLHWSQPEILCYDPDPKTRLSYPDLIEQDGRYWITETQKPVARVHEVDKTLLEGLWRQGEGKTIAAAGRVLDLEGDQLRAKEVAVEQRLDVRQTTGLSLDFWIEWKELSAGQVILDNRDAAERGLTLVTTAAGRLRIEVNDGKTQAAWESDRGRFQAGQRHHVVITLDAGPKIITFVVDGVLCDGDTDRQYGWGRWQGDLGDVSGSGKLRQTPSFRVKLHRLRVYDRYLRTSEAVSHFRAGL